MTHSKRYIFFVKISLIGATVFFYLGAPGTVRADPCGQYSGEANIYCTEVFGNCVERFDDPVGLHSNDPAYQPEAVNATCSAEAIQEVTAQTQAVEVVNQAVEDLNNASTPAPTPTTTVDPRCPPGTKAGDLCYVPLEPLPGVDQTGQASFADLVGGFFRILINIGAFVAVTVLVIGGITYMVSEKTFSKLAAKERIKAAFWGLAILGGSWLILNTINPGLLTFKESLVKPSASSQTTSGGTNNATAYTCYKKDSSTIDSQITVKNSDSLGSASTIDAFARKCPGTVVPNKISQP